jgi:hypothetical protein
VQGSWAPAGKKPNVNAVRTANARHRLAAAALAAAVGARATVTRAAEPADDPSQGRPVVTAPSPTPPASPPPAAEPPLGAAVAVGATYGGTFHNGAFWDGPGVSLSVDEPSWHDDPELWLDLRYLFPRGFDPPSNVFRTIAGRAGVSVRWWAHLRLGVGVGVDRDAGSFTTVSGMAPGGPTSTTSVGSNWQPAARAFARVVSRSWHGFSLGVTLLLDAVHSPDPVNTLRPGLTVEAWWRS